MKRQMLNLSLVIVAELSGMAWEILDNHHCSNSWLAIPWGFTLGTCAVLIVAPSRPKQPNAKGPTP